MSSLLPLLPHPEGLPWPTEDWPRGEIDPKADHAAIGRLLDHAFGPTEPEDLERTHGVVIIHRGELVAERYAHDQDPDEPCASWSMAKSITSALIGILVRDGKLDISKPMPVKEWAADERRSRITIDQMLRMIDGLRFREAKQLESGGVAYYAPDESDVIPMLFGEGRDDVAGWAATLPYVAEPGTQWNYNSGASNLLARLVAETVGGGPDAMLAFMQRELFGPLGMKSPRPTFDAAGNFVGSAYCACSARDFARFGYLYLRGGVWDGVRILPEGWADYARTPSRQSGGVYGAHFWTIPGSLGSFYCGGAFGQRTLICPRLDLVIVRVGNTAAEKTGNVVSFTKELLDAFRPTVA